METQFAVFHIAEPIGLFTRAQLLEKFTDRVECETLRVDRGEPLEPLWGLLERWRAEKSQGSMARRLPVYTTEQLAKRSPQPKGKE